MEIQCTSCGVTGKPASIDSSGEVVAVECAECGAVNRLEEADSTGTADGGRDAQPESGSVDSDTTSQIAALRDKLEVPEPGEGPRCDKCAAKLSAESRYCERCGLDQQWTSDVTPRSIPWQQPPPGKHRQFHRAQQLWENFENGEDTERLDEFVNCVRDHELFDLGVRKLRFFLAEHPRHLEALRALETLVDELQNQAVRVRTSLEERVANSSNESWFADGCRSDMMIWIKLFFALIIWLILAVQVFW